MAKVPVLMEDLVLVGVCSCCCLEYIMPVIFLFPGQKNLIDLLGLHQEDCKNHLNTSGNVALTHRLCWPSLTPGAASYHCFAGNWAGECGSCNQLK